MPLFTIGVTTYRRPEMLRECLTSLLQQTCGDFEVLVGNDYVPGPISQSELGFSDPRIKILNFEKNKGELNNMNYLLSQASGEYFTWLADDDFMSINALSVAKATLEKLAPVTSLFMFYRFVPDFVSTDRSLLPAVELRTYEPADFLRDFFGQKLSIAGCYGFFKPSYLLGKGGMKQLGVGFSPYADNLLAVEAALENRVHVLPYDAYFIRQHDQSLSHTSTDLRSFETARNAYRAACGKVFEHPQFHSSMTELNRLLLRGCLFDLFSVLQRCKQLRPSYFRSSLVLIPFPSKDFSGFILGWLQLGKLMIRLAIGRVRSTISSEGRT